jgi:hypothetical protein
MIMEGIELYLNNPIVMGALGVLVYLLAQGMKRLGWVNEDTSNRAQTLAVGAVALVVTVVYGFSTGEIVADFSAGVVVGISNVITMTGGLWGVATLVYHRLKDYWESNPLP